MYNIFSFIVQQLFFVAQFVQCYTQYCTQGLRARQPSLSSCSCAQPGLLVLYASTRAQAHHHHADYIIAVRRAPSPRPGAPALPAGAPACEPSAPALTLRSRNRGGVLGQNCFFIYLWTAASGPADKAAVPAMLQIASSGGSSGSCTSRLSWLEDHPPISRLALRSCVPSAGAGANEQLC